MAYTTIDDPSAYFQTKLYSGNSTQTAITYDGNSNLQPDWIWAKSRTNTHYHDFRDSTRGVTKRLVSNTDDAESTKDQSYVSFDSNGFTLGDDTDGGAQNTVNTTGNNYVSWGWKANGGTTSQTWVHNGASPQAEDTATLQVGMQHNCRAAPQAVSGQTGHHLTSFEIGRVKASTTSMLSPCVVNKQWRQPHKCGTKTWVDDIHIMVDPPHTCLGILRHRIKE